MSGKVAFDTLTQAIEGLDLPSGSRILLAVSGGPDSVALLDSFMHLSIEHRKSWRLRVGHVNHQLRGEESAEDEQFVRELCRALDVPLDVAAVDTREYARKHRLSLETAARDLRYEALKRMLEEWSGDVIVTGHTQSDQAETVLLHLLRGAGLEGLSGMRERTGAVVRPFLSVGRQTILESLNERQLTYRVDHSNDDLQHLRNSVRSQVLPVLERVQPRVETVLTRTASLLALDAEYMVTEAERALAVLEVQVEDEEVRASAGSWCALHPSLQRQTLRLLLRMLLGHLRDVNELHIAMMCDAISRSDEAGSRRDQLPHGLQLYVENGQFCIRKGLRPDAAAVIRREIQVPGEVQLPQGKVTCTVIEDVRHADVKAQIAVSGPFHAFLDADVVGSSLIIRSRLPGDRLRPLGLEGTRKLQDIFVDRKVPESVRDSIPVFEGRNHIVWIPGLAVDERAAVTVDTNRVAHVLLQPL